MKISLTPWHFAKIYFITLMWVISLSTHAEITITTFAGSGSPGFDQYSWQAKEAKLTYPSQVAVDNLGNVYIADTFNHSVRKVDTWNNLSTIAGNGTKGYSGDGGPGNAAQLNFPWSVATDNKGNIYIADADNHRIRRIDAGGTITTVAGNGTKGSMGDGGAATSAQLNYPDGITVDNAGNLYIADSGSHVIRKVDANTRTIMKIAGTTGVAGFSGDGGRATDAKFNNPKRITVTSNGILYIVDKGNHRIRRVETNGIITTVAGNGIAGFGGDSGPAITAQLNSPSDVTVDVMGNLYIADTENHRIRKVDVTTTTITTIAGSIPGYEGDGGPANRALLNAPDGVTLDSKGNLLVADSKNNRIRQLLGVTTGGGTVVTENLWVKAIIRTVERGPIEAVWRQGADAKTTRGDRVIWGYFYANPADVSWGLIDNPDAFVKIWYDVSGRIDVNFFHVSVPEIEVYSSIREVKTAQFSVTTMSQRYARHTYRPSEGIGTSELLNTVEVRTSIPDANPIHNGTPVQGIQIGASIQSEERGPIDGVWRFGSSGNTLRGDQVAWGFFYANPNDVSWGNPDNPDLYVKVWYDPADRRIDVNFFHVSVPNIKTYSGFATSNYEEGSMTTLAERYTRHEYRR